MEAAVFPLPPPPLPTFSNWTIRQREEEEEGKELDKPVSSSRTTNLAIRPSNPTIVQNCLAPPLEAEANQQMPAKGQKGKSRPK
jgi:hypothetical protein